MPFKRVASVAGDQGAHRDQGEGEGEAHATHVTTTRTSPRGVCCPGQTSTSMCQREPDHGQVRTPGFTGRSPLSRGRGGTSRTIYFDTMTQLGSGTDFSCTEATHLRRRNRGRRL